MTDLWLKIKVWTKTGLLALGILYAIFFMYNNSEEANFWWWFGRTSKESVLVVSIVSFIAGAVVALLGKTILGTIKQLREMAKRNRAARMERDVAEMKAKADMLQTRDRGSAPPPIAQ